jgi:hypothetical protein
MATLKNLTISDTGFVQLPSGTTAQRGAVGETIVQWTTGGYNVIAGSGVTASATSWTCPIGVTTIRLLMVGGGGAGGFDVGGGGGAGGLIYYASYAVTPGNIYNLSIGAGASTTTSNVAGANGSSTVFNGITAYGGGGSGSWSNIAPQTNTSTMGSGGGSTSNRTDRIVPTTGQGNPGGLGGGNLSPNTWEYSGASGGGGAGAPGGDGLQYNQASTSFEGQSDMGYSRPQTLGWYAGSSRVGYGGDGLAFDISGSVVYYAGGGGASSDSSSYWGIGGKGGGGRGGPGDGTNNATSYGGGGGGAGSPNIGGSGYAGTIIISYNTVLGEMRYNSTTGFNEMLGAASGWETIGKAVNASGGSASSSGGYTIRTYTSPGTFTLNSPGTVEALVVAGGGGGGSISGGGGAGGMIYQSRLRLNAGVYPVTVGTGGSGTPNWYTDSMNPGNPSSFATIEAIGGGAAANYTYGPGIDGEAWPGYKASGGSGGGGPGGHWQTGSSHGGVHGNPSNSTGNVSVSYGGTGVIGQGHPGGSGTHGYGWGFPNSLIYAGGGGGGAGATGGHISEADRFGTGGKGLAVSISGSTAHYAGGGAGSCHQPGGVSHYGRAFASGGLGGGGTGGGPGADGGTGTANTGGGGGGGHHSGPNTSGGGGSGIVIIRHL